MEVRNLHGLLVLVALGGCGATRATTLLRDAPTVAVQPVEAAPGVVLRAPVDSTMGLILGSAACDEAIREELALGLAAAGFRVRTAGADATLHVRVTAWDLGPRELLGRARIALELQLVHRDGRVLWTAASTRPIVATTTYTERTRWREYVRRAVSRVLADLR